MCVLKLRRGTEPLRFSCAASCRAFFIWGGNVMPDYEKLYHLMVGAAEDALTALETGNIWDAKRVLLEAEQKAEDMYIDAEN